MKLISDLTLPKIIFWVDKSKSNWQLNIYAALANLWGALPRWLLKQRGFVPEEETTAWGGCLSETQQG